jgi:hypothetical protein
MEDKVLKRLQKYLEYIRYNTTNFGLRLLKPFSVQHYVYSDNKYKVFFDNERKDSYWVEVSEYNKYVQGKLSNTVSLKTENAFNDDNGSGYYMSLTENKLEANVDALQFLYGLRLNLNDIFYKIKDVKYMSSHGFVEDRVKIYVIEDFHVEDFLEVNKFIDTAKYVKKGMGYSMEIDDDRTDEYVLLSDAKRALEMSKKECLDNILKDFEGLFPMENKISQRVSEIVKSRLSDGL